MSDTPDNTPEFFDPHQKSRESYARIQTPLWGEVLCEYLTETNQTEWFKDLHSGTLLIAEEISQREDVKEIFLQVQDILAAREDTAISDTFDITKYPQFLKNVTNFALNQLFGDDRPEFRASKSTHLPFLATLGGIARAEKAGEIIWDDYALEELAINIALTLSPDGYLDYETMHQRYYAELCSISALRIAYNRKKDQIDNYLDFIGIKLKVGTVGLKSWDINAVYELVDTIAAHSEVINKRDKIVFRTLAEIYQGTRTINSLRQAVENNWDFIVKTLADRNIHVVRNNVPFLDKELSELNTYATNPEFQDSKGRPQWKKIAAYFPSRDVATLRQAWIREFGNPKDLEI